jgi:hypothetical protein
VSSLADSLDQVMAVQGVRAAALIDIDEARLALAALQVRQLAPAVLA